MGWGFFKKRNRAKKEAGTTTSSPGWDAINRQLEPLYPGQEPKHWGTIIKYRLGGPDPIDGISAYEATGTVPHWHFVTYGMSELHAKESDNPDVSGWGFEFTMRIARRAGEPPPMFALSFLNNLARYVFDTGNVFAPGHHLDLNGPIALGSDTTIRAVAFAPDPQLGTVDTPHGRVSFLQVVGLTLDELSAARDWDTLRFLELVRPRNPLLVTDLSRPSYLATEIIRAAATQGARRDGSSQDSAFVSLVEWSAGPSASVRLGATAVREILRALPRRLPYGAPFTLAGERQAVRFEPGPAAGWREVGAELVIAWPADQLAAFTGELAVRGGTYRWTALPGFELTVVPSQIKDREGNVVEVVG
jgi:hypothetical protein